MNGGGRERKGEEGRRKERREGRSMGHGLGWKGEDGRCIMAGDGRGRKEDLPWMEEEEEEGRSIMDGEEGRSMEEVRDDTWKQ